MVVGLMEVQEMSSFDKYSNINQIADAFSSIISPPDDYAQDAFDKREVHVSSLVKDSAVGCVTKMLNPGEGPQEAVHPYFGFRGNALALVMSPDALWREVRVDTPLGNGWSLVGTMDFALLYAANRVLVGECKVHNFPQEQKQGEWARRQAALYLSMLRESHRNGAKSWNIDKRYIERVRGLLASLGLDGGLFDPQPMTVPEDVVFSGTATRILGSRPDLCMGAANEYSQDDLDFIYSYYAEKANIVAQAADDEDPQAAATWDRMNEVEFSRPVLEVRKPVVDLMVKLLEYDEGQHFETTGKAIKERLKPELRQAWASGALKEARYVLDEEKDFFVDVKPPRKPGWVPDLRYSGSPLDGDG